MNVKYVCGLIPIESRHQGNGNAELLNAEKALIATLYQIQSPEGCNLGDCISIRKLLKSHLHLGWPSIFHWHKGWLGIIQLVLSIYWTLLRAFVHITSVMVANTISARLLLCFPHSTYLAGRKAVCGILNAWSEGTSTYWSQGSPRVISHSLPPPHTHCSQDLGVK